MCQFIEIREVVNYRLSLQRHAVQQKLRHAIKLLVTYDIRYVGHSPSWTFRDSSFVQMASHGTGSSHQGSEYDCVVIGAGVEGSATAYKLAESGQKTLLLEQFELLHTNGSSHGGSRITRHSYAEKCFSDLTTDLFSEWAKVERFTGQTIFVKTGLVTAGKKPCPVVESVAENLREKKIPHRMVNGKDELREVMPDTTFPDDYYGVHEEGAGVLLASKAVGCLQELVRNFGGEILDRCEVVDIEPGTLVTVRTKDDRVFRTKNLVICAGTWAGLLAKKLGLDLPLKFIRCSVAFWKVKVAGTHSAQNGTSCLIDTSGTGFYGLPSLEYPGYMKIAIHGGYEYDPMNPDEEVDKKPPYNLNLMTEYVADRFPGLVSSSPAIVEKCKYTMTPDEIFILDKHPRHGNVFFGAGFSGTGFKMAPIVGNILRDFVLGVKQKYNIDSFKLSRF